MSGEMLDSQRPKYIRPREEGHEPDPNEYTLQLSGDDMYLALRALAKYAKEKRNRAYRLKVKFGSSADPKYQSEADRAFRILETMHNLTGGRYRYEARNNPGE